MNPGFLSEITSVTLKIRRLFGLRAKVDDLTLIHSIFLWPCAGRRD